jgi:MFS family permease
MAFMGSSTEALAAAVVPDLFFLHERGWWMGIYTLFLTAGGAAGAIISGFVITGLGWRWSFWVPLLF